MTNNELHHLLDNAPLIATPKAPVYIAELGCWATANTAEAYKAHLSKQ